MEPTKIAIHTDGAVSCGTRLWRFRGRLQLTVVVKAVFAIVPDAIATPAGPGEIVVEDRHRNAHLMGSVEAASDLAPHLTRCDVVFVGHAHAPGGPASTGAVRLGLSRDGQRLLDKTLHVYGDRGKAGTPEPFTRMPILYERALGGLSAPNPIGTPKPNLADPVDPQKPAGFGPISRLWPARTQLVDKLDRKALEARIAEIPETMPWGYFQAAPQDQQVDLLRGGEWLVLDGLHPTLPRVQTRLPSARGAARIAVRGPNGATTESALELVCDTLAIDGDRQTFSLSWRGRRELLEGEALLPSLSVLAALETPEVPADWPRIRFTAAARQSRPAPAPAPARTDNKATMALGATMPLGPTMVGTSAGADTALPFAPSGIPAQPASIEATPWSAQPILPAPVADAGAATASPQPSPFRRTYDASKTMAISMEDHPLKASRPAMPFAPTPAVADTPREIPRPGLVPQVSTPDAVLPPDPVELAPPIAPEPPAVVALRSEPPPSLKTPLPPPPASDPWARPVPAAEPAPPAAPAVRPQAFERPQAAAVKGSFYSKFK